MNRFWKKNTRHNSCCVILFVSSHQITICNLLYMSRPWFLCIWKGSLNLVSVHAHSWLHKSSMLMEVIIQFHAFLHITFFHFKLGKTDLYVLWYTIYLWMIPIIYARMRTIINMSKIFNNRKHWNRVSWALSWVIHRPHCTYIPTRITKSAFATWNKFQGEFAP